MHVYSTLSEAVRDLQLRGFTYDFNLLSHSIECKALNQVYGPDQIQVAEFHRFEGDSSTDDSSILYALEINTDIKGTLLHAYGTYAEEISPELLAKLKIR